MLCPLVLLLPSICIRGIRDKCFAISQNKTTTNLTYCNVTMYTIDTFSDPFPRGQ